MRRKTAKVNTLAQNYFDLNAGPNAQLRLRQAVYLDQP